MENSFKIHLYKILEQDESLWINEKKEINETLLKDKADKLEINLLNILSNDEKIRNHFFYQMNNYLIFDVNKFKYFIDEYKLDNSYTHYRNEIGLNVNQKPLMERDEFVLDFPYKDCILEGGMAKDEQHRNEIFFNTIIAKDEIDRLFEVKALSNWKRYSENGEEKVTKLKRNTNGIIKENLLINGNNLLVLNTLLSQFTERIKVIYIDPPYNTGDDDFGYNDNFNHSSWLTFMKNRLEVAKQLLSNDGSVFIQINDIEQAYLKVLCDEIFGRENFQTTICVQMSYLSGVKMAHKEKKLPKLKEYILFYTKSQNIKLNPQYIPATWNDALERYTSFVEKCGYSDDECKNWKIIPLNKAIQKAGIDKNDAKKVLKFKLNNSELIFRTARNRGANYSDFNPDIFTRIENSDGSYYFVYKGEDVSFASDKVIIKDGIPIPVVSVGDIWTDIGINNLSNEGGVDLRFGKKPEKLLERLINLVSNDEDDIILDFFAGTSTTGAVAHKLRKQYIMVEQLETHINKSIQRLSNVIAGEQSGISKDNNWVGGGSFIYLELAKWNETASDLIRKISSKKELLEFINENYSKYYMNYNLKCKAIIENI